MSRENMKKLLEAMDFAGEPQQKPGDQATGVTKPKSKGKFLGTPYKRNEHPLQDKLVGEAEEVEEAPDVANDIATPDKPTSVFAMKGLSPQARRLAATRELGKTKPAQTFDKDSELDFTQKPKSAMFNSKDYDDVSVLEAKLIKAYEDYVGDPYKENNVVPKATKKPGKDAPKAKKAKREPEANELNETTQTCPECHGSGQDREQGGRCPACDGSGNATKVKKEKPFRDAAATGNKRDFDRE